MELSKVLGVFPHKKKVGISTLLLNLYCNKNKAIKISKDAAVKKQFYFKNKT